jgi:DNA repair protein RadC
VTRLLRSAGELLGIDVVDHVVLGEPPLYYSFSEHGDLT